MLLRILLIFLALVGPVLAADLHGRIVGISDGDTATLLTPSHRQVHIRLAEIDAPEHHQPYGERARQELAGLIWRREVRVEVEGHDRYGRTIGRVFVGPLDVSAEMVRRGGAWIYLRYARDPALAPLEAEARRERRGLWDAAEAQRGPPWAWRHRERDRHSGASN